MLLLLTDVSLLIANLRLIRSITATVLRHVTTVNQHYAYCFLWISSLKEILHDRRNSIARNLS